MKRYILFLFAILALVAMAQDKAEQEKMKTVLLGVSVNYDVNYSEGGLAHYWAVPGWGLGVGGDARFMLGKDFFIQSGVKLGYGYSWLRAADKFDHRIQLNRWRVGVPLIFGYMTGDPKSIRFVPQIGVEYRHFFSTTTAGQTDEPRLPSSALWYPNVLTGGIGMGIYFDECQFDFMVNTDITRANKPGNYITCTRNYHPVSLTLSFRVFM